jgi:hypothetical protein
MLYSLLTISTRTFNLTYRKSHQGMNPGALSFVYNRVIPFVSQFLSEGFDSLKLPIVGNSQNPHVRKPPCHPYLLAGAFCAVFLLTYMTEMVMYLQEHSSSCSTS